jgi:LmbE family N-acetylglucosaminyl deacetylase
MGNGTAIARNVAAGSEVHLLCVTRGGAGWNGLPAGRRQEELTEIRAGELNRAAAVLGITSVELWDYPDSGVPACDQGEITERIAGAVKRIDPEVVLGWGPDGGYGHPDHIAVGACTDAALAGTGREHYHLALHRPEAAALEAWVKRFDPQTTMHFIPVDDPDLIYEPSTAELEVVRRAVECHESQLSPIYRALVDDPETFFWLARNSYVRVGASPAVGC